MSQQTVMRAEAEQVLQANWRSVGFTCPNAKSYPWLWLWDSCFHSIVWAELGHADRAVSELELAVSAQDADGFIPHLLYLDGSSEAAALWGRPETSSITQPPIYGHTIAELVRRGVAVSPELKERAGRGLRFLLQQRRRSAAGLIEAVHPWETGCDHSPRWDDLMVPGHGVEDPFDNEVWYHRKGELLATIQRSGCGAPLANDEFAAGSVAFSALVAFCAVELAEITGDAELVALANAVSESIRKRWNPDLRTWIDDGPTADGSGRIRTSEALLCVLVDRRDEVIDAAVGELFDPTAFGGAYGPTQVHRQEQTYRPKSYWRGPGWPQIDYLLWVALNRAGRTAEGAMIATTVRKGAMASGWAEYWEADSGAGGGAAPQSWTTLAVCMDPSPAHLPFEM